MVATAERVSEMAEPLEKSPKSETTAVTAGKRARIA